MDDTLAEKLMIEEALFFCGEEAHIDPRALAPGLCLPSYNTFGLCFGVWATLGSLPSLAIVSI